MQHLKKLLRIILLSTLIFSFSFSAFAETMPIPTKIQSVMILKILAYDKNLPSRAGANIKIGVFGNSSKVKSSIISDLNALSSQKISGLSFSVVDISSIGALSSVDVIYVTPDSSGFLSSIKSLAQNSKKITITGVPDYVKSGNISVAIDSKDNKPKILVNLNVANAEGSDFSSKLLSLSDVIK